MAEMRVDAFAEGFCRCINSNRFTVSSHDEVGEMLGVVQEQGQVS